MMNTKLFLLLIFLFLVGCTTPASPTPLIIDTVRPDLVSTQTNEPAIVTLPAKTETPQASIDLAYPAVESTVIPTDFAYPAPTFGPSPTLTATLSLTEKSKIVGDLWYSCQQEWKERASAFPRNKDLAGLVFRIDKTLWQVDAEGSYILLSCMPGANLSPKGERISFAYENDFWFFDIETEAIHQISNTPKLIPWSYAWSPDERTFYYIKADHPQEYEYIPGEIWSYNTESGETRQITNSPENQKGGFTVWPKHPDWIVYHAMTPDLQPGPGVVGAVFLVKIDGTEEKLLSENGNFYFSPDGLTLMYGAYGGPQFLRLGQQPESFPWDQYTSLNWTFRGGSNPAWSSDGKFLAMYGGGVARNGASASTGIAVFDLTSKKADLLHPFTPVGSEAPALYFTWSPNSQWLAAYFRDEDFGKAGLWVLRVDGSAEHFLGPDGEFLWSPEGNQLVYQKVTKPWEVRIFDIKTLQSFPGNLPQGAHFLRWDSPDDLPK